ncbi:hypothetical protein DFH11DRAFT_1732011 [Phellopilus nigrolimitatus]|nr:hypothetical protein DFH11DRAFT_1732011 [Phellopilus nigrolimitatus]
MAGTGDVPVVAPGDMAAGNMAAAGPAAAPVAREMPVNGAMDEIAATGAPDAGAVVNDVSPGAGAGADGTKLGADHTGGVYGAGVGARPGVII